MYTVYVLLSDTGKRYTGHTEHLDQRLVEHNSGRCKSTKVDTGWRVIYTELYKTRGEAMKREKWLKSGVGRRFLDGQIAGWSPPTAE